MARTRNKLTAAFVRTAPVGKHGDGGGLWLNRREDGSAAWGYRFSMNGRRREMGLGRVEDVTLGEARKLAEAARAHVASGTDPIRARAAGGRATGRADTSLMAISEAAFEARKAELRADGKAGRWFSPLRLHVLPVLGRLAVEDIDQRDIADALAPIWHAKAETARKALGRLGIVLRHAAAMGLDVDLQATDKAAALLGRPRHEPGHIPAMDWREVPGFYASLADPTVAHMALRLLILTGARSRPIRFLRVEEIAGGVWTIPAASMKGRKGKTADFRVPLSGEALRVIDAAMSHERDGYLFPSVRSGVVSDATMSRMMERRGLEARPHGFRSSLRTWLAEATDAPHELAETILGHVAGSGIVRAYRRTDYLEQRMSLAERWAGHVTGGDGKLLRLRG